MNTMLSYLSQELQYVNQVKQCIPELRDGGLLLGMELAEAVE